MKEFITKKDILRKVNSSQDIKNGINSINRKIGKELEIYNSISCQTYFGGCRLFVSTSKLKPILNSGVDLDTFIKSCIQSEFEDSLVISKKILWSPDSFVFELDIR